MNRETPESPTEKPILPAELPTSVVKELNHLGGKLDQVQLAAQSDLAPDGQFGEQWLLIDPQDLWVIDRHNGSAALRYRVPLDQIRDAKVERCVGNGLIQVTVDDQPQVLLHYSNELTDRFGRVAHYLHERAELGAAVPIPLPDADSHRCMVCKRHMVDPSSKVCPNCIQRDQILRRLLGLARPYWGQLGSIVALLLAGVVVDLLPPYLTRILIDDVLRAGGNAEWLIWLVGGLLGLRVLRVVITILTNRLQIGVGTRFTSGIRDQIFAHLKRLPVDDFD